LTFTTLLDAFDKYFFDDLANTPNDDDRTPVERKDEAISCYGVMGHPQQVDDDFLIKTSVNVDFKGKATEKRGIKLACGIFASDLLSRLLRKSQPNEVRQDCENKALVVVNIRGQWVKAFLNSILTEAARTPEERLFDHLVAPYARRNRRNRKRDVDRARNDRHEGAVSQQAPPIAPENMASAEAKQSATQVADDDFGSNVVWGSIPCLAEE
jgi:putative transposase